MSLSSHSAPAGGGELRPGRAAPGAGMHGNAPSPGGNVYGSARVAAPPGPPSARTYRAQRPTMPDVPPPVVTAPGPSAARLAFLVGLLPVVLSFVGINRQMWIDEHVTYYITQLTWPQFWKLIGNQDLVHATYYIVMRLWTDVTGSSLIAMRLPSILGMGITAGVLTLVGRRLFSTRVGLLAGLVFGVLPTVTRYGQEIRSYAIVSALVLLATLALTYAIERADGLRWTLYTIAMVLLVYMHVVGALMLLPHAILVLHAWRRERDRAMGWWVACAAGVVVAASPLLYLARRQSGQVDWITADAAAVRRYPSELFGSDPVVAALVVLALVGAVQLARNRAGNMIAVLVWAVFPPIFCYVTFDVVHLFLAKYALFVLPAWALLVGGVLGVPKRQPEPVPDTKSGIPPWAAPAPRQPWLGRVAVPFLVLIPLLIAAVGVTAHRDLRRSPLAGEPDFRGAAAVVDRGFQPGDAVVYVGTYRFARLPFVYELKSARPKDVFATVPAADNGWFHPQDCQDPAGCLKDVDRVWLVVTNFSGDDWTGLWGSQKQALEGSYRKADTVQLDNARVVLLERKKK